MLALFLALGGTSAYAINEWTGANIVDESLTGSDVRGKAGTGTTPAVNGSLTTNDIAGQPANGANGTPFIDGTLTQWDIKNDSLGAADLGPNSVGTSEIGDGQVTPQKLSSPPIFNAFVERGLAVTVPNTGPTARDLYAYCPTGETALGGGVRSDGGTAPFDTYVISSRPNLNGSTEPGDGDRPNGWFARVINKSGPGGDSTTSYAFAICAKFTP
jgi:hypothetical protein